MMQASRLFSVGMSRVNLFASADDLRQDFLRTRALPSRDILEPDLLARIDGILDQGGWSQDGVDNLLFRKAEDPPRAGGVISLMLCRPELLRWVEAVTGCDRLERASGRVIQIEPNASAGLDWHSDMREPARRIGITINLGKAAYEGGKFELRVRDGEVLAEHRHVEQGSALLFAVGRDLQHRLLPITAGGPRQVYTGWFYGKDPR